MKVRGSRAKGLSALLAFVTQTTTPSLAEKWWCKDYEDVRIMVSRVKPRLCLSQPIFFF